MLRVHENTIRRWVAQGLLKSIRVGKRRDRLFEKADVMRLLRKTVRNLGDYFDPMAGGESLESLGHIRIIVSRTHRLPLV